MKTLRIMSLVVALVMLLSTAALAQNSTVGDHDNNIVVALAADISGFNNTANTNAEDQHVYYAIYDGLYVYDENCNSTPHLAQEEIIVNDTERQYRIVEGAKFSDGSEITAADVAASVNAGIESGIGGALFKPVESVSVVDDYTISIKTAYAYPQLTLALAHPLCRILPASFLEAVKADPNLWSDPICSGAYKVKSRTIGTAIELIPNEFFWDAETAAKNDSLTFKIIPEASTRTIMVQTGEADMCVDFSATDIPVAEADTNVTIYTHPSARMHYIFLNYRNPLFANKLVRQALNYAFSREDVIAVQLDGHGTANYAYVAPGNAGWLDNPMGYSYDPVKAKALLTEAGYPDGITFDLTCDPSFNNAAALIQAEMAACGITMNIVSVAQMADIVPLVDQDQCEAGLVGWGCMPEDVLVCPRTVGTDAIGANNFARYSNPELDALWANGYESDPAKRIEYYQEWQKILCEESPWLPLYVGEVRVLANSDLQGVEMNSEQPYHYYGLCY